MTQNRPLMANRVFHALVVAVMVVTFVWPSVSWGEDASPGSGGHNMTDPNTDHQALLDQITELQAEVAKLRAADHVLERHQGSGALQASLMERRDASRDGALHKEEPGRWTW